MLKRIVCTAGLLAVLGFCAFAQEKPAVFARGAVLMAADTGEVLFAKNEHERLGMASTTKIMTALLTLERAAPEQTVTATHDMVRVEGTSMGLRAGDRVSLHDLVIGMLLPSGNDAANAAAVSVAGSVGAFTALMNRKAAQIGMTNTHFVTPSGLDDDDHYSTAYDMALLGCYAMRDPLFAQICASQKATVHFDNETHTRTYTNHNRLLRTLHGACGVKTGYTKKSGRCLVSAVERGGILLVCATLNDPNDWADHEKLYDYGFSLVHRRKLPSACASVAVFGAAQASVTVRPADDLYLTVCADQAQVQVRVFAPPYCFAPVHKGQVLGRAAVYRNGRCVAGTALLAQEEIPSNTEEVKRSGLFSRMTRFWQNQIQRIKGKRYAGRKSKIA